MQPQIKEDYRITSADADFCRQLKVSSLIDLFIQTAWKHAEIMGYGVKNMDESGLAWMLVRLHVKIDSLPKWNEQLSITTWPKGIRRLFYLRDFLVHNEKGETIVKATSEWLMIDIRAKRPKLKDPESIAFKMNIGLHALENEIAALESPDKTTENFEFSARYSDLDLNRHVTASRYIDWMFDTFDCAFLENHKCRELILNYLHEISFNEKVLLKRKSETADGNFLFESVSAATGKVFFRGKICF